jgi:RNA polymerase sigma-70 factor (ECF subfamily)
MVSTAQARQKPSIEKILLCRVANPGTAAKKATAAQVYCSHSTNVEPFDIGYLARLKQRDPETMAHFAHHFNRLLKLKLRAAGLRDSDLDDVRQETLLRVLTAVDQDSIHKPESLAGYVYGVCEFVMKEHWRILRRRLEEDCDELPDMPDYRDSAEDAMHHAEMSKAVQSVMRNLNEKDRKLLTAVFLDEKPKDEICREFGVSREYLRVLVHRALLNARKWGPH